MTDAKMLDKISNQDILVMKAWNVAIVGWLGFMAYQPL